MTALESEIQWFLARDSQQHGPLTAAEMAKLVELGHLRPSDLVWRPGFADWRPAIAVFPNVADPVPPQPGSAAAAAAGAPPPPSRTQTARPQQRQLDPGPAAQLQPQSRGDWPPASERSSGRPAAGGPGPAMAAGPRPYAPTNGGPSSVPGQSPQQRRPVDPPVEQRSGAGRIAVLAVILALLGGGIWAAYQYREPMLAMADKKPTPIAKSDERREAVAAVSAATAPSAGTGTITAAAPVPTVADIDAELQARPLWSALKQEFPEWYDARVNEAAQLGAEGKSKPEITRHLIGSIVALRREHAQHALAASSEKHKSVASAFLANLKRLSEASGEDCYEFISKGETAPPVLSRLDQPETSTEIEAQVLAIVSAISEGRKSPIIHNAPGKADYDVLASELTRLGWTPADMQLFADPKALARAPRDRVCSMLKDWFTAHLAIPDAAIQQRLLFETLKPVISG